ncbi:beta-mannosidase-like isoform X1 [Chanodichthys erythropterus]|uniref:beta-mannosidase-like isoform X1 n=1 Tax=Chanodichthys erythropterus TaxID=933992 RepID=UPI00351E0CF7
MFNDLNYRWISLDNWTDIILSACSCEVRRLKSHPSVVIWSGNNENEAAIAADWFNISAAERPLYVRDYVSLYVENIRDLVLLVRLTHTDLHHTSAFSVISGCCALIQEDGTRPFLVSSPTNGVESGVMSYPAFLLYDPHYGDTHYYSYYNDCWN